MLACISSGLRFSWSAIHLCPGTEQLLRNMVPTAVSATAHVLNTEIGILHWQPKWLRTVSQMLFQMCWDLPSSLGQDVKNLIYFTE